MVALANEQKILFEGGHIPRMQVNGRHVHQRCTTVTIVGPGTDLK
jgi:hypothetical protein